MDRELLEQELIRDEGRRLIAYRDSVGLWTVGIGHLLGEDRRMTLITDGECRALFRYDVDLAEAFARAVTPSFDDLDDVRQRVLVNMAFNLGGRLRDFKRFLAAVAERDWDEAAREMSDSTWARQVGGRARRLQYMMRTGLVPTAGEAP